MLMTIEWKVIDHFLACKKTLFIYIYRVTIVTFKDKNIQPVFNAFSKHNA